MRGRAGDPDPSSSRLAETKPRATKVTYGPGLRHLWLLDPEVTFLNHGSFGATPRRVLAVQDAWRRRMERQPVEFLSRRHLMPALRNAAAALAEFVHADPADLVFVENATAGVNAVLRSLALEPGDEILITDHVYPAVRNTVRYVCERTGARMREATLPYPDPHPEAIVEAVAAALSPQVRMAVLDLITSPTGLILPVATVVARCRAAGARVLVDAAHAPGMIALDIPGLGADWVTGNMHKWLFAPKGAGVLWASPAAQRDLHPTVISHGLGLGFAAEFGWVGTRDPTAWLSVPAALDFYCAMGGEKIRAHIHDLACRAADRLAASWRTEVGAAHSMLGAMAAIRLPVAAPATREAAAAIHDRLLARHRIEVPVIPFADRLWVRISAQIYNGIEDYDRLAAAIAEPALIEAAAGR